MEELSDAPAPVEEIPDEPPPMELALEILEDAADVPSPAAPPQAQTSVLFPDFSQEELLAVMQGLQLVTLAPGDVAMAEGEAGGSLFLLTTGVVKAWVRGPGQEYRLVREMHEGDFFGEISLFTGGHRTATVTAATRCELLELDRRTLDEILRTHPRVFDVLRRFSDERSANTASPAS
jgi:cAMP-dependent protein kinase regulator